MFHVEERLPDGSSLSQLFESRVDRRQGPPGVPLRIIYYAVHDPGRPQAEQRYRVATTIMDPELELAEDLAAPYARRWGIEISVEDISVEKAKLSDGRPQLVLRTRKPDGVIQEPYGLLNVRNASRWPLHPAALGAGVDPDRLSVINGLRKGRRKLSRPAESSPRNWTTLIHEAISETSEQHDTARLRDDPPVLSRAVTYYPPIRAKHTNWPQPTNHQNEAITVPK